MTAYRFLLLIVAFVSCGALQAQEDDVGEASARELFAKGQRLVGEGQYQNALKAWAAAYTKKLPDWRELAFDKPVQARFMTRDVLRDFLIEELATEYPDEMIEADEIMMRRFGFLEPGIKLKELMIELYSSQIAGFYNPKTKNLYLIAPLDEQPKKEEKKTLWKKFFGESAPSFDAEEQKMTLSHEMAHALADQHFDLFSLSRSFENDDDATLALNCVVEGEAMVVMMMDMLSGGRPAAGRELLKMAVDSAASFAGLNTMLMSFGADATFRKAPLIMRESLLFPYMQGMQFCAEAARGVGWKGINRLFRSPPTSTEQVLHPEKFQGPDRDEPTAVSFKKKSPFPKKRWELLKSNVMGEFSTEILLRPVLKKAKSARAAAGWDGDLYSVYREKSDNGRVVMVWSSTWDSRKDAQDFASGLSEFCRERDKSDFEELDASELVPQPELAWKRGEFLSGVWLKGQDVIYIDGVTPDRFDQVRDWALAIKKKTKRIKIREFEVPEDPKSELDADEQGDR